jgi:RHS repeat-associated protein
MYSAPVAAATPEVGAADGISVPATTWVPPETVNRTSTGGAPPSRPWAGAGSSGTALVSDAFTPSAVTCDSGVATGILKSLPLERFPVFERTRLLVNKANGNVVISAADLIIKGTGQNLSVDHVYNSKLAGGGALGAGWSLNTGQDVGLTFEASGDVTLHGESAYCAKFVKNGDGSYRPAPGLAAEFKKTSDGYTLTFNGSNEKWSFTTSGWLTKQADRNGNANSLAYSADGTLASVTDSQGRVTTFEFDVNKRLVKITDPTSQRINHFVYNDLGQLAQYSDASGVVANLFYDAAGNLTLISDAHASTGDTVLTYDSADRVTNVRVFRQYSQFDPADTSFSYGDKQTVETDPNGNKITFHFDDQGRQIDAVDALGHKQSQSWTANSDVATTTDGLSSSVTYTYDTLNNLIGTKQPTGANYAVGYTKAGQPHLPTSVKDPHNNEVTRDYDDAGNVTKIHSTGLNVDVQINTYNQPKGTLATRKDGNGNLSSFGYDAAGNLITFTPPAPAGQQRYTYDSLSRVTSVTDGRGIRIDYAYDAVDRVVAISRQGSVVQSNTYDTIGNLIKRQVPGVDTDFQYTKTAAAIEPTRVQRTQAGAVETVTYDYDKAGNLIRLGDVSGVNTYNYDAANRLTSQTDPFGQTITFAYDNADHRTATTFPGSGTQSNGYDSSGRQTSLKFTSAAGAVGLDIRYSYTTSTGADSDLMQSKTVGGTTTTYRYDGYRRLVGAAGSSFTNDNASNLTNREGLAFSVNAANQFIKAGTDNIGFDGAGNLISQSSNNSSFSYSSTNQLVDGTANGQQIFSATYDSADQTQRRTVTENVGGTSFTHTFGQSAIGTLQVVDNGARTSYARDSRGTLLSEKTPAGTRYNLITDYQGSVLALADATGNVAATYSYSPYGSVTATGAAANANFFRWIGTYQLRGGVNLTGYRYYNSTFGRFTQPDPTGQEFNAYAYANGDPINHSDPAGDLGLDIGGEICFYVCLGFSHTQDTEGGSSNSLTFGFGNPGVSGGVKATSGKAGKSGTLSGSVGCSAGYAGASVSTGGSVSLGLGTYASTPKCSLRGSFTL